MLINSWEWRTQAQLLFKRCMFVYLRLQWGLGVCGQWVMAHTNTTGSNRHVCIVTYPEVPGSVVLLHIEGLSHHFILTRNLAKSNSRLLMT